MATTKKRPPVWLIVLSIPNLLLLVLFLTLLFFSRATQLLWYGVPAQGTIIGTQATKCLKTPGVEYAVQFADRAGQTHTATFRSCDDYESLPQLSPGDLIAIVYFPDNPTIIGPSAPLPSLIQGDKEGVIFFGFCQLLLLGIWVGRRLRQRGAHAHRAPGGGSVV